MSETLRRRSLNDKDILLGWGKSEAKGDRPSRLPHELFEWWDVRQIDYFVRFGRNSQATWDGRWESPEIVFRRFHFLISLLRLIRFYMQVLRLERTLVVNGCTKRQMSTKAGIFMKTSHVVCFGPWIFGRDLPSVGFPWNDKWHNRIAWAESLTWTPEVSWKSPRIFKIPEFHSATSSPGSQSSFRWRVNWKLYCQGAQSIPIGCFMRVMAGYSTKTKH